MPHMVITGASRRLGLFLTEQFLLADWRVTAITRSPSDALLGLAQSNLRLVSADYSHTENFAALVQKIGEDTIDLLFHNASYFAPDAEETSEALDQMDQMLKTHVALPMFLNNALTGQLKQSANANIIHMTDIYVDNPNSRFSHYCASKAALENLSKSFAKRLAPEVRVNSIQPGALKFLPEHSDAAKQAVLSAALIQQEAGFEPIYQTIQFILNNPFITGTAIKVDGGRSICR